MTYKHLIINNLCLKFKSNQTIGLKYVLWLTVLLFCLSSSGKGQRKLREVDNSDYKVYTSFFTTEKLPTIEIPQFFENAIKARKVFENTVVTKEINPSELSKVFGEQFYSLIKDYKKNNTTEYIVKQKIKVPYLTILTKAEKEKRLSDKLVEVPSHLTGEYVSLSRVGFNKTSDRALFHIIWNGSAVTSYYVIMQKQNNKRGIIKVEMDDMIIF